MKTLLRFYYFLRQGNPIGALPGLAYGKTTDRWPHADPPPAPAAAESGDRHEKSLLAAAGSWLAHLAGFGRLYPWTLVFLLLASGPLAAQPTIQWNKTIGGNNSDHLYDVQQTSDGGYILGGRSISNISSDKTQNVVAGDCDEPDCAAYDYWVVKLNPDGTKAWDKTFGGGADDNLMALQQTSDGGYLVGGSSSSGSSGDKTEPSRGGSDFWVLKLDVSGNKLWDRTFGGTADDFLNSLELTSSGGCIVGGSSASGAGGDKTHAAKGGTDFWVMQLDAAGNKLWDKTYGGPANDNLTDLQATSGGSLSGNGYILGGSSASGIGGDKTQASKGGTDFWVVLVDVAGNKMWDKTYGGTADDFLTALERTSDGGYFLGGSSASGSGGDKTHAAKGGTDYWVVKLDLAGNKSWDKTFGGSADDNLSDLEQTSDDGFILGGTSSSGISGDKTQVSRGLSDFWVVKLNGVANKVWDKTIGGSDTEIFSSLQQTSDGGYILGGHSDSSISGEKTENAKGAAPFNDTFDYWAVKLNPVPAPGQQVLSFTLINTNNETVIRNISDGEVINLATLPSRNLNFRINTNPTTVGSVHYALTGTVRRVKWDNTAPYSLFGDDNGDYNKWVTPVGSYSLTATPYTGADATGTAGTPLTVNFTVIDEASTQFSLTVPAPTNGTVSKNPNQASYASGSTVQLTATANPGYVFSGWTGDASGTTNPLPVVMNSNKTISATFSPTPTSFTLTVPAPTNGTVTKDPNQASYASGSTVELTATANSGYVFSGWSGDASGTTNPLEVVMNSNKTISAAFSPLPAGGQQVIGFTLINTNNETVIRDISDGEVINLATLPSRNLNIRINTNPATVGSVHYALTGTVRRIKWDNTAPYSLFGDDNGNYNKWVTPVGSYSLTATPYTGADVTGTAGTPLTIQFTVVDQAARLALTQLARPVPRQQRLVYPNPTHNGLVKVQLGEQQQGHVQYTLLSLAGTRVAAGTIHLSTATSLLTFDFSRELLHRGVYLLKVEGTQGQQVFRIMRE